jgi:integrase/recombinase XerD
MKSQPSSSTSSITSATSASPSTNGGRLPPDGPPPKKLPRVLSFQEIEALLKVADPRDSAIVLTLWGSGCRVSELAAMRRGDLDLDRGTIKVLGKGDRERICVLPPRAVNGIRRHLVLRKRASYDYDPERGGLLWDIKRRGIYKMLRRLGERAGVDGVHPHAFRHTCATMLVDGGTDLRWVQAYLGHASIRSTQLYTHVANDALRAVAAQHPMEGPR